jgi:hypothetical protein
MGFFSGLFSTPSISTPASGFYSNTPGYQSLYNHTVNNANSTLYPNGQLNTAMFQPVANNQFENNAQGMISQGVTPTAQSLQSDISMLTNPYDSSVIDGINKQATGQNSLVNQAATLAGQQGSNRSFLGTSDVEQNRLNSIGQFQQSQYNNAINQALGPLAGLRQQDISNNLAEGQQQRGIDTQSQQAPYNALLAALGVLQGTPQSQGQQAASGLGGGVNAGSILNTVGTLAGIFSDRSLKENIVPIGIENGFPIYEFNYRGNGQRFIGVMAQDVEEIMPEAVHEIDGYLAVDYNKIGVKMRAA